jgi:hypothetical protein
LDICTVAPILDLTTYEPAYWLAALAKYRYGSRETRIRRESRLAFMQMFSVDCEKYELIKGWRADDRYFAYLSDFLGGAISYEAVVQAMKLGNLGQQIVIKGANAYAQKKQVDKFVIAGDEYLRFQNLYLEKERQANLALTEIRDIPGRVLTEILAKGGL